MRYIALFLIVISAHAANVLVTWKENPDDQHIISYWLSITNQTEGENTEYFMWNNTNALYALSPGRYGFSLSASNILGRSTWSTNLWLDVPASPTTPGGIHIIILPSDTIGFTNLPSSFRIDTSLDLERWEPAFFGRSSSEVLVPYWLAWKVGPQGYRFFRMNTE